MSKTKKVLLSTFVALLTIIVVAIVAFFIWYQYLKANYYVLYGAFGGEPSADYQQVTTTIPDIAIQKNDPGECSKIKVVLALLGPSEGDLIATCYSKLAQKLNDEKTCDYITRPNEKSVCIEDIALSKNDLAVCGSITDQLDEGSCYRKFVEQGADMSVCENIDDSKRGTELSGRDWCYMAAAEKNADVSICTTKIRTQEYKNGCFNAVAVLTKDPTLCEKIQEGASLHSSEQCKKTIEESVHTEVR